MVAEGPWRGIVEAGRTVRQDVVQKVSSGDELHDDEDRSLAGKDLQARCIRRRGGGRWARRGVSGIIKNSARLNEVDDVRVSYDLHHCNLALQAGFQSLRCDLCLVNNLYGAILVRLAIHGELDLQMRNRRSARALGPDNAASSESAYTNLCERSFPECTSQLIAPNMLDFRQTDGRHAVLCLLEAAMSFRESHAPTSSYGPEYSSWHVL